MMKMWNVILLRCSSFDKTLDAIDFLFLSTDIYAGRENSPIQ